MRERIWAALDEHPDWTQLEIAALHALRARRDITSVFIIGTRRNTRALLVYRTDGSRCLYASLDAIEAAIEAPLTP